MERSIRTTQTDYQSKRTSWESKNGVKNQKAKFEKCKKTPPIFEKSLIKPFREVVSVQNFQKTCNT